MFKGINEKIIHNESVSAMFKLSNMKIDPVEDEI
jgi:hypothetical protein